MSEIKHTPGPWINHGRIPQPGLPHSAVAAKTLIARVYSEMFGDKEQEAANANLIAAAPELLEAASKLFDLANHFNVSGVYFTEFNENREALQALEDVIAKATGGSDA